MIILIVSALIIAVTLIATLAVSRAAKRADESGIEHEQDDEPRCPRCNWPQSKCDEQRNFNDDWDPFV